MKFRLDENGGISLKFAGIPGNFAKIRPKKQFDKIKKKYDLKSQHLLTFYFSK